jgi:AraC family transcriptional regulator
MTADGGSPRVPKSVVLPSSEAVAEGLSKLAPAHAGVSRAVEYVAVHYADKFPARDIAEHCGLSRFQFSRSFHSAFGLTFLEYLLRYRILAACERLRAANAPVTEIAFAVGFHDGSYFARMFRRYTGMLPSQYARWHALERHS